MSAREKRIHRLVDLRQKAVDRERAELVRASQVVDQKKDALVRAHEAWQEAANNPDLSSVGSYQESWGYADGLKRREANAVTQMKIAEIEERKKRDKVKSAEIEKKKLEKLEEVIAQTALEEASRIERKQTDEFSGRKRPG